MKKWKAQENQGGDRLQFFRVLRMMRSRGKNFFFLLRVSLSLWGTLSPDPYLLFFPWWKKRRQKKIKAVTAGNFSGYCEWLVSCRGKNKRQDKIRAITAGNFSGYCGWNKVGAKKSFAPTQEMKSGNKNLSKHCVCVTVGCWCFRHRYDDGETA